MTRRARLVAAALLLTLSVAVAGCGSTAGSDGGARGDSAAAPAKLDFTATTVDGKKFDGSTLAGKPVVLWFWAPWCPTCGAQAPGVSKLAKKHEGEVAVVGVAGLDERAQMRKFVSRTGVSGFTNLADEKGVVWKRFGVTAQSTYVLLDSAGKVSHSGYLDDDELVRRVAELAR